MSAVPEQVDANSDMGVRIAWEDGHVSQWSLLEVRKACACATCHELRKGDQQVYPIPGCPPELEVVDADLVGSYGVSFCWNDGHRTGIYRWEDLRGGCPCDECRTNRRVDGRANPLDR